MLEPEGPLGLNGPRARPHRQKRRQSTPFRCSVLSYFLFFLKTTLKKSKSRHARTARHSRRRRRKPPKSRAHAYSPRAHCITHTAPRSSVCLSVLTIPKTTYLSTLHTAHPPALNFNSSCAGRGPTCRCSPRTKTRRRWRRAARTSCPSPPGWR